MDARNTPSSETGGFVDVDVDVDAGADGRGVRPRLRMSAAPPMSVAIAMTPITTFCTTLGGVVPARSIATVL